MFNALKIKTLTWKDEVLERAKSYEDMGFDKIHAFCYAKESRIWQGVEMSERCDKCSNYEQCLQTRNVELRNNPTLDDIKDFIQRRFPNDDDTLGKGSYYMALILKDRFGGEIYFDKLLRQFVVKIHDSYYNHAGMCSPGQPVLWDDGNVNPVVMHDFCM